MALERKAFKEFCRETGMDPTHMRITLNAIKDWIEEDGAADRLVEIENILLLHTRNRRSNWKMTAGTLVEYAAQKTTGVRSPKRTKLKRYQMASPSDVLRFDYSSSNQVYEWEISPSQGWVITGLAQNGIIRNLNGYTDQELKVGWENENSFRIRHRFIDGDSISRTVTVWQRPGAHGGWEASRLSDYTASLTLTCNTSDLTNLDSGLSETVPLTGNNEPDEPITRQNDLEELTPLLMWLLLRPYGDLGAFPFRTGSKT